MTHPDGDRRDGRQNPSGGGSSASSDAMGNGAGADATAGDDTREKQASNGEVGTAEDGNELEEKAPMAKPQ